MSRSHLVIVFMGLPGTGKSTLAQHVAGHLDCRLHRTDEIREDLHLRGAYDEVTRTRVYRELESRVDASLKAGHSVIADATFSECQWRNEFRTWLLAEGVHPFWVWCTAPEEILKQRLCARRPLSDADLGVYHQLERTFEEPDFPVLEVDTHSLSMDAQAELILHELGIRLDSIQSQ